MESEEKDIKEELKLTQAQVRLLVKDVKKVADELEHYKIRADEAEKRPTWEDHPDEGEVIRAVMEAFGMDALSFPEAQYDRALNDVRDILAEPFPAELRPDTPLRAKKEER